MNNVICVNRQDPEINTFAYPKSTPKEAFDEYISQNDEPEDFDDLRFYAITQIVCEKKVEIVECTNVVVSKQGKLPK